MNRIEKAKKELLALVGVNKQEKSKLKRLQEI
jgi:hypothetical protein